MSPAESSHDTGEEPSRRQAANVQLVVSSSLDSEQFAVKFRSAYRTLWTIATGIVNEPMLAEDVVQEAAVIAISKLSEFDPATNFTAWMAKIVRFLALNQFRRGKRQPVSVDPAAMNDALSSRSEDFDSSARSLIDSAGRMDASRRTFAPFDDRVLDALNSVADVARACLLLRTLEGLNYDEISRVLEIPPGTAMSHVHRTRKFLRERLAEMAPTFRSTEKLEGGSPNV